MPADGKPVAIEVSARPTGSSQITISLLYTAAHEPPEIFKLRQHLVRVLNWGSRGRGGAMRLLCKIARGGSSCCGALLVRS
jgi:hypothetical protein